MTQEIMALCRSLGAGEDQEELLLPLVQAAQTRLAGRLRAGVSPEDCGPAFLLAVALTAVEELEGAAGDDRSVTSFTAGDLTIRRETGGGRSAGSCGQLAQELLSPWLGETGFCFQGVRG